MRKGDKYTVRRPGSSAALLTVLSYSAYSKVTNRSFYKRINPPGSDASAIVLRGSIFAGSRNVFLCIFENYLLVYFHRSANSFE